MDSRSADSTGMALAPDRVLSSGRKSLARAIMFAWIALRQSIRAGSGGLGSEP